MEKYRRVEERPMLNFLLKMSDMMNGTRSGLDGDKEKISELNELKTEQWSYPRCPASILILLLLM